MLGFVTPGVSVLSPPAVAHQFFAALSLAEMLSTAFWNSPTIVGQKMTALQSFWGRASENFGERYVESMGKLARSMQKRATTLVSYTGSLLTNSRDGEDGPATGSRR